MIKILAAAMIFVFVSGFFCYKSIVENRALKPPKNPRVVITKSARKLEFFDGGELLKTYKIALGFAPAGGKESDGDGKTPEGEFYIFTKNANSKFYLSLGLSYPSIEDAARGWQSEIISRNEYEAILEAIENKQMPAQNTNLGGEIYIHGGGAKTDWTRGCVALSDEDMKEFFDAVSVGTMVKIEP
ncbi:MAG: L,D-transpeptidase family protein [Pyrinomonadaceae bacterium]